jgi:hypothetical protein
MAMKCGWYGWFSVIASASAIVALVPVAAGAQRPQTAAAAPLSQARQVPAETTAAARKNKNWAPPRTSWGHPDLQGVWTSDDMRSVPTQRPEAMAGRMALTPEEFNRRAAGDDGNRDRAVNKETVLRNEYGVRTFGYTSLVTEPADGRIPPMTPEGFKRAAPRDAGTFGPGPFNTYEDFSLYDRCITRGIVGSLLPVLYGNGLRIVQTPQSVVISYEMIHDTRVIPLDGRAHNGPHLKQYLGDSRGHWDGNSLVVDTTNFTDQTSIGANGNGTRHSDKLKMTERFTRIDPEMIDYEVTIDDPVTYTRPFTMRMTITTQPDYQLYEYACHEGNGAVKYALSGERAYERSVADAGAKGLPIPPRDTGSPYGPPAPGVAPARVVSE